MKYRRVLWIWKELLGFRVWKQFIVDIFGLPVAARVGALFYGEEASACCEAYVEDYVWDWRCGEESWNDVDDVLVGDADWLMVHVDVDWGRVARGSRYQGG